LGSVVQRNPNLKAIFPKSVFSTCCINFGPVTTRPHRDVQNYPFGLCAIQALGMFDHTKGGHLVLWEANLALEFPAGATALIPSSLITHSNTPISGSEKRASFVQYTQGELLRYAENGGATDRALQKADPELAEKLQQHRRASWKEGILMFPNIHSIEK
ncbi:hypothetical protein P691DRAFT_689879, partial [Macrolepiota fuliginosa MF-IS2]